MVPYKKEIIDYIKTLNSRKFNPLTKRWEVPLSEFNTVLVALSELCEDGVETVSEFQQKIKTAKYKKL